jgi:hypothetical protein
VGVGQLGGHVELEVLVVRDHRVAQLDHSRALLLESLTVKGETMVRGLKCCL